MLTTESDAVSHPPAFDFSGNWLEGGTALLDASGRVVEMNEALRAWFEAGGAPGSDESFWQWLEQRCPQAAAAIRELGLSGQTFGQITFASGTNPSLSRQWLKLEATRIAEGWVVRLGSVLPPAGELAEATWDEHLRSDSARRDMFVRLLRAETQLDSLSRRWPGVIFSQRPDFSFRFASAQIEEWTGVPILDWQRHTNLFWQSVHESDVEELQQQCKRAVSKGQPITSTFRIRHAKTGRIAYLLEYRQPTLSKNGLLLGYEGVWLDVTRQTIAERRLSSAAWKETLAVLTLGMAHDFGNIMAGIHSLAESFLAQVGPQHEFHEGLGLIKSNALQASQLVTRMVNLHLGQTGERNYHNLNEVVADLAELVRKVLPRRIQIQTELSPKSLPLYVDAVEFRQVIINLAINAADAMPKGGTLVFRTSAHETVPELDQLKGTRPRLPAVCLTVKDSGCGIKRRHLATLFDPFFTTKATHKGSGLGLYNAALFVEKHQGCISVQSVEGAGSTFQVWLPQADFSEAERVDKSRTPAQARRRTLLLAGRDHDVLERMAETFRSQSFYVVAAGTPEAAGDFLNSGDYQFDAILHLAELNDAAFHALVQEARQQSKGRLKTIIQPVGCDPEALDPQSTACADLLVTADMPPPDFLRKVRDLFAPSV